MKSFLGVRLSTMESKVDDLENYCGEEKFSKVIEKVNSIGKLTKIKKIPKE